MRWIIIILILTLSVGLEAQSVTISVIENPVISNLEEIQEILGERQAVVEYQFVNIDLPSLQNETSIRIEFFGVDAIVYRDRLVRRNSESYSWFGFSEDRETTVIFTVNKTVVNVSVITKSENFKIETIAGQYVLERFDLSLFPIENCTDIVGNEEAVDALEDVGEVMYAPETEGSGEPVGAEVSQCKLRVLVMYTVKAKAKDPNIVNTIRAGIDNLNFSFINSNIVGEAELVYVGETEYVEQESDVIVEDRRNSYVAVSKNMNNFQGVNDGYMDNVHSLRDQYSADICILIMDNPTRVLQDLRIVKPFAGRVSSIRSSFSYAFAVVEYDKINAPQFSFTHEIGHLFGARHSNNNRNIPYPYGHGFATSEGKKRTIMGHYNSCSSCNRVLYWSGPNTYLSGYYLGNVTFSDNVRVILENFDRMMYLSTTNQILTVYNSDVSTSWAKTIYSGGDMLTSGNVVIQWGRNYVFRAESTIELKAGFEVQGEAQFEAFIEPCGIEDFEDTDYKKERKQISSIGVKSNAFQDGVNIKVYPNPTSNSFSINLTDVTINGVLVELFSVNGSRVKFWDTILTQGNNHFNLEGVSSGTFLLQVSKDGEILKTIQLIKK